MIGRLASLSVFAAIVCGVVCCSGCERAPNQAVFVGSEEDADFDRKPMSREEAEAKARVAEAQVHYMIGEQKYLANDLEASLAAFDQTIEMDPRYRANLWQRAVVLYQLGKYEAASEQLRVYNEARGGDVDVENAIWDMLSLLRKPGGSLESARENMIQLDAARDPRPEMAPIYDFYRGTGSEEAIRERVKVPEDGSYTDPSQMHADLYLGMFYDAIGDREKARPYLEQAAQLPVYRNRFSTNTIAKIYWQRIQAEEDATGQTGATDEPAAPDDDGE